MHTYVHINISIFTKKCRWRVSTQWSSSHVLTWSGNHYVVQVNDEEKQNSMRIIKRGVPKEIMVKRSSNLLWESCTDNLGHGEMPEYFATENHVLICDHADAEILIVVHGLCYHQRSCRWPWTGLPPGSMLMSKVYADRVSAFIGYSAVES